MWNPQVFRAYDIRGVADTDLTDDFVQHFAEAFLALFLDDGKPHQIVLGYDARLSSPRIHQRICSVLLAYGHIVYDLGMITTPMLYFSSKKRNACAGIMITASHNPKDDNGFKLLLNNQSLSSEHLQDIYHAMEQKRKPSATHTPGELRTTDIAPEYFAAICACFPQNKPVRVVVDAGNAAAAPYAAAFLQSLGHYVTPLYCLPDGNFPHHHPDPSQEENLAMLKTCVRNTGAQLGIAFDGDGDRIGVVDAEGKVIWPDAVLYLLAKAVLKKHPGAKIVYDVKSSTLLETLSEEGGIPIMHRTGHSFIKRCMHETGALIGGEMSGHLFFGTPWYGFDDALYAATFLLHLLGEDPSLLGQLPTLYNTPELGLDLVEEGLKWEIMEAIHSLTIPETQKITIDGIRFAFADGFSLVRASNTSAKLVFRFEGSTQQALEAIQHATRDALTPIFKRFGLSFSFL